MSLSLASRRRYQTDATSTTITTTATSAPTSTRSSSHLALPVRKQHSLIEPSPGQGRYSAQQRGYLSRGLSVGRSIENIRQKLYAPHPLGRQASLAVEESASGCRLAGRLASRDKPLVAWSSTSSLLKAPLPGDSAQHAAQAPRLNEAPQQEADKNRINLNIVLAQTIRATNEQEPLHSDIDSDRDTAAGGTAAAATAAAAPPGTALVATDSASQLAVSSALTVQRRPPLVRAMSAPVRLDESSKSSGVLGAAQKRSQQKLRRRKIFTRAASSTVVVASPPDASPLLSSADGSGSQSKKPLSRARSVIAPDVITLVSLLSSEGSDSEREDNSAASTPVGGDKQVSAAVPRSPQRRAPLLRKTGKSVSFQDSYPPTFQLASKEYSHMIRRGSIAPLAARIRANRPPTAPPVSIFLSEPSSKSTPMDGRQRQMSPTGELDAQSSTLAGQEEAKKENNAPNCNAQQASQSASASASPRQQQQQQQEYNFPLYVCSIKERECWKLHQKMCAKGVSVSYETVLRGMLTPTEFRHFQKQREHEETKAQEAAEAEAEATAAETKETKKTPATAIERLSESLLQGK
ncbi:hypothetical protein KR222_007315 [Zaprionus bogoriensis]|nr:hypothetical protein KR222_007315 [Zaprionus bogoriensis]